MGNTTTTPITKVSLLKNDVGYVTEQDIDNKIGNIDKALEEIIKIQNELIGTEAESGEITYYYVDGTGESTAIKGTKGMTWGEALESEELKSVVDSQGILFNDDGYLVCFLLNYMCDLTVYDPVVLSSTTVSSWGIRANDIIEDGHSYGSSWCYNLED